VGSIQNADAAHTHSQLQNVYRRVVRTNIDIDDELLERARAVAGTRTKRDTVDLALRVLVGRRDRASTLELHGTVAWQGNLDESRTGR
jgi:Arc/MetJ family transcription regulator